MSGGKQYPWMDEDGNTYTLVPFVISCPNCGNPHQASREMAECMKTVRQRELAEIRRAEADTL